MSNEKEEKELSPQDDEIQAELIRKANRSKRLASILPYAGMVGVILFFFIATKGKFLESANLALLLNQCFITLTVMSGAIFVYTLGNLDMSVGSVMALSAFVMTKMFLKGLPFIVCFLTSILLCIALFSITAIAKNKLGIIPFVASLCIMNICTGIVVVGIKQGDYTFPYSKISYLNTVPVKLVVLLTMLIIGYVLYNYTSFGKELKAIGGSPTVARISGINVEKLNRLAYACLGIAVGVASFFAVLRGGKADTSIGSGINLNIMVGIVLGGFPLYGGANCRYSAPFVGAITVTALTNGLSMLGQASAVGYGIRGLLFIIIVGLTYEKSKGNLIS